VPYNPPLALTATPQSLQFTTVVGQTAPPSQTITVSGEFWGFTVTTPTSSGGNWLTAATDKITGCCATVKVNPPGLGPGTYEGTVILNSPNAPQPGKVPVTLVVLGSPPPISVTPSALNFSGAHGTLAIRQNLVISTGSIPVPVSLSSPLSDTWLSAYIPAANPTPTTAVISAIPNLPPGTYTSFLIITAPPNSNNIFTVPVTLTVTPEPQPPSVAGTPPLATAVVNAASQTSGPLSPGEIVTLFGQNFGPATPAGVTLSSPTQVSLSNSNVQVLFNNVPAPLLYVSSVQINAVVPYEVTGPEVTVTVLYNGNNIPAGTYALQASTPALFTQDGQVAGAATRGSVVQLFATGAGATVPPNVTGAIAAGTSTAPALPVSVTIGGAAAPIIYAGNAPGEVSSLLQINAQVPVNATLGADLPVILTIGGVQSPANAAISVK